MAELNDRQKKFCECYVIDFNGANAAVKAGYSEDTAKEQASRLLTNVNVQSYLSQLKRKAAEDYGITKQDLINELRKIAFFDIRKIFNSDNNLVPVIEIDNESAAAISGIESDEIYEFNPVTKSKEFQGFTRKIKTSSKIAAIERISQMLGYDEPIKTENTMAVIWNEQKNYTETID